MEITLLGTGCPSVDTERYGPAQVVRHGGPRIDCCKVAILGLLLGFPYSNCYCLHGSPRNQQGLSHVTAKALIVMVAMARFRLVPD